MVVEEHLEMFVEGTLGVIDRSCPGYTFTATAAKYCICGGSWLYCASPDLVDTGE